MEELDKKIFVEAYRDYLMECITESKYLRENVSFEKQLAFYNWVKNAPVQILEQYMNPKKIRNLQSTARKILGYWISPLALINLVLPGGGFIAHYFYRRSKDPCYQKCGPGENIECQKKCAFDAASEVINKIKAAATGCNKAINPESCHIKMNKQIARWQNKRDMISHRKAW
jgi:hypothetical protein